jgi:hypothetical protein
MTQSIAKVLLTGASCLTLLAPALRAAPVESIIYNFPANTRIGPPNGELLPGPRNVLYGTTAGSTRQRHCSGRTGRSIPVSARRSSNSRREPSLPCGRRPCCIPSREDRTGVLGATELIHLQYWAACHNYIAEDGASVKLANKLGYHLAPAPND